MVSYRTFEDLTVAIDIEIGSINELYHFAGYSSF